jgi:hypothetical protein
MNTYRLDAAFSQDGTLTHCGLPFQAGDSVEIILMARTARATGSDGALLRGKVIHYDRPTEPVAEES